MLKKIPENYLAFDDILLVPRKGDIDSRKLTSVRSEVVAGVSLELPFLSSPMVTVTDKKFSEQLYKFGGLPCSHRFKSFSNRKTEIRELSKGKEIFVITVGLSDSLAEIIELHAACNSSKIIFLIDVAHGHHERVIQRIEDIKTEFGDIAFNGTEEYADEVDIEEEQEIFVCAGTVCTEQGAYDLAKAGADAIRVNVGASPICSTRLMTGCGIPQFQAILECSKVKQEFPNVRIWADGGMKKPGDCVKALAAGADVLMFGTPFAELKEAPGEEIHKEDGVYKVHFGMASENAMKFMDKKRTPEGIETLVKVNGNLEEFIEKYVGSIQSGLSYLNCYNVKHLHESEIEYCQITNSGIMESKTL